MKHKMTLFRIVLVIIGSICLSPVSQAKEFFYNITTSTTKGVYKNSIHRDSLTEAAVSLTAEYLDKGGVTVGYGKTLIQMKPDDVNDVDLEQHHRYVSGRINTWPEELNGRVTLRLDGHYVSNNDPLGDTSGVIVLAPQMSWTSLDDNIYYDLGYANSKYPNQLSITQVAGTMGLGFNDGADWFQLRGYQIRGLNPARAANKTSTLSWEMKITHHFASRAALVPSYFSITGMSGERAFAVDMDALSVANIADLSNGSASLLLGWDINVAANFSLLVGNSSYRDVNAKTNYALNYVYGSLTLKW